jgi:tRNA(Ile)-lysidine synthase
MDLPPSSPLHPLERALLKHLGGAPEREGPLLSAGSRGLILVSGGSDSTALLLLLHALRGRLPMELEVAHFDHGLRPNSAAEAEWVAERAARCGLPFHLRRGFRPKAGGVGIQAAARAWRARESEALLEARGAQWIATGHQRDDHLETLLLKLLRGVHLAHIRGLAPRHGAWVRPLLPWTRRELEGYLRDRGESWLEDPSNRWPRYARNRVRHELMPLLDRLAQGGIARRLEGLERQSRLLAEWLAALPEPPQNDPAAPPHWIEARALTALPLLARTVRLQEFLAARMPGQADAATLEKAASLLECAEPWELHLGRRRTLRRRGERLLLAPREPLRLIERQTEQFRVLAPEGVAVNLSPLPAHQGGEGEKASFTPLPPLGEGEGESRPGVGAPTAPVHAMESEPEGLLLHNLDPAQPLRVRPRQPGDRFHPAESTHPLKVADFLRDQGVPLWERERVPLVISGEVVVAIYPRWVAAGHDAPEGRGRSIRLILCGW